MEARLRPQAGMKRSSRTIFFSHLNEAHHKKEPETDFSIRTNEYSVNRPSTRTFRDWHYDTASTTKQTGAYTKEQSTSTNAKV